ncbi:MAG: hypothetical protein QM658_00095 [Gordonia sp. (in: high G+C Gram-positive bacteria)]
MSTRGRVRVFTPAMVLVSGTLLAAGTVCVLIGLGSLVRAAAAGTSNWGGFAIALGILAFGALLGYLLISGVRADRRLGPCPSPSPGEQVVVAVHPVARGTAAFGGLMAASMSFLVVGAAIRGKMFVDPDLTGEHWTTIATAWLVFGGFLVLAAMFAGFSAWLVTNRRSPFLWVSERGLGYLPDAAGDDGYLPWNQVASIQNIDVYSRGVVSLHKWVIVSVTGQVTLVQLWPGVVPDSAKVFEAVGRVAPNVRCG